MGLLGVVLTVWIALNAVVGLLALRVHLQGSRRTRARVATALDAMVGAAERHANARASARL